MSFKTRIARRAIDVVRIGAAVSRPGIDPRVWVSLAVAMGESQVKQDSGVYVDVKLLPSGEEYSARVPADYEGTGFGFYAKIHANDDLVIAIPSGDPAHGLVVISRLWSAADPPPQLAINNPEDVILVVETDKNLRLSVQGKGQVFIESAATITVNCPDIRLGDLSPSEYVARADKVLAELNNIKTAYDSHIHNSGMGPTSPPTVPLTTPQAVVCETTKVK